MCLLHQSRARSFSDAPNSYAEIRIHMKLGLLYFRPNVKTQIKAFTRISKIIFQASLLPVRASGRRRTEEENQCLNPKDGFHVWNFLPAEEMILGKSH